MPIRLAPEPLFEAAGLCLFMLSACVFGVALEHPASPLRAWMDDALARRACMGAAMGATAFAVIHSPWGRRSGAHINPAVTLAYLRLGRIGARDAAWYVAAQVAGGICGVAAAAAMLGTALADASVRYVVTMPGAAGPGAAFAAELLISAVLMASVLWTSAHPRAARFTGTICALLVAVYITFEAPVSGMSMNPARTLASAVGAGDYAFLWLYLLAPSLGMLIAAEAWRRFGRCERPPCAVIAHDVRRCRYCNARAAGVNVPSRPSRPLAGRPIAE